MRFPAKEIGATILVLIKFFQLEPAYLMHAGGSGEVENNYS